MAETPDSHDLDKLTRWHIGLESASGAGFPVCGLFLASGDDNRAHDIFRIYRTAFEELGAGFHDLVIFGQHGMSSTCVALMTGLGLSNLRTPSLVLISGGESLVLHTNTLPAGKLLVGQSEEDSNETPWRSALEMIRQAVKKSWYLSLDDVEGLERIEFSGGTLGGAVGRVKKQVESA